MLKRLVSGIILELLLTSMLTLVINLQPIRAESKTWTVDDDGPADFHTIQDAVNTANEGDTIFVKNGTYYENIVLNKTLILVGEDSGSTIIDGIGGRGTATDKVVYVTANSTDISGFTIRNGSSGIYLYGSINSSLSNNDVCNNEYSGICLVLSYYCEITANYVYRTNHTNIMLFDSRNNTICSNNATGSMIGSGIGLQDSPNCSIINNTSDNNQAGGAVLIRSEKSVAVNNKMIENGEGIRLEETNDAAILNNEILYSDTSGIYLCARSLYPCRNVTVTGNKIINNSVGILLENSLDNNLYHNNFTGNTQQVYVSTYDCANIWDDGYPSGGNYWSDYNGIDSLRGVHQNETGSDGIGDSPYIINSDNQDNYPLVKPYPVLHDIGIVNVSKPKTVLCQGYSFNKTVKVMNYGMQSETFGFTVEVNFTIIESRILTLTSGNSTDVAWNTSGYAKGNYTIWAYASPVPNETYTVDNTFTCWIIISMVGDICSELASPYHGWPDGRCDMSDIYPICRLFGVLYPDPRYEPNCDIDNDMRIDMSDIYIAAKNFGKMDP